MGGEYLIKTNKSDDTKRNKPEYRSPEITTYTEEQILDQIGPVHAVFESSPERPV
jgi:hypothetical protein